MKKQIFTRYKIREVDQALYWLLQIIYELKLISEPTFHYATTCETNLFATDEDV